MIIAIATDRNAVASHFGRCPQYTLVTIENGQEIDREVIETPGHSPGLLPRFLAEKGVETVVAGGMGPRAQSLFTENGIETYVGTNGSIDAVVSSFLKGTLRNSPDDTTCDHF